jgi:hypothetical protein
MSLNVGDIPEVDWKEFNGPHPALIIAKHADYKGDFYICVMFTSNPTKDTFSYPLRKEMYVDQDWYKEGQCRLHSIHHFRFSDFSKPFKGTKLKLDFVDAIKKRIALVVLGLSVK